MLSLTQSASVRGSAGEPLPPVWEALEERGTRFLRGQLALVAAGPGTGKSAFVLNYALKSGVCCLYFSADSDAFVQLSRALAIMGDMGMTDAVALARSGAYTTIDSVVGNAPVRFSYDPSPSLAHIETQVHAYEELFGDYPELIVIDNALDVVIEDAEFDQSQTLDSLMGWLHDMARKTEACVVVLHHVTGPYNDAKCPIPLSGVKGQIGRVPELILTLHRGDMALDGSFDLHVSTVKNRGQRADPSGMDYAELSFHGDKMNITDKEEEAYPSPYVDPWAEQEGG